MKRVVVTGIGIHSSIGKNKTEVLQALKSGYSGYKLIPKLRIDTQDENYINKGGHLIENNIFNDLQKIDESVVTELSIQVIKEVISDSKLDIDTFRGYNTGISLAISTGTSFSFIKWLNKKRKGELTKNDLTLVLRSTPSITGDIARHFSIKGTSSTISTAC